MKFTLCKVTIMGVIATMLSLPSCDGIMSGIYDDETASEYGFIKVDELDKSGVIYINTTSYMRWTYIDFHNLTADTLNILDGKPEPQSWDFAVHRYDTKTNGGSVIESNFTELSALRNSGKLPDGTYVSDIWTEKKIAINMDGMMQNNIIYTASDYNAELSKWLFVDTSGMPPTYTPSNKVYVIKLKDGTTAAIRLRNFMNATNVKGYMTIEYIYPLEF